MEKRQSWFLGPVKWLIIAFFSVLLALFLLIIVDRLAGNILNRTGYFKALPPQITMDFKTSEFDYTATTSAQGLRNRMIEVNKPENTLRILALGDSFTFGWGVNAGQTWPETLEKKMQETGQKVEVINAGIPGMDLNEEINVCRAYADRLKTDIILVGIFATDDLYQLATYRQFEENTTFLNNLFINLPRMKNPVISQFLTGSPPPESVINFPTFWQASARRVIGERPDILAHLDFEIRDLFVTGRINPVMVDLAYRDPDYLVKLLNPEELEYSVIAFSAALDRFQKNCPGNRKVAFVLLPPQEMVSKDYFPFREKIGYKTDEQLVTLDLDSKLRPLIEKKGYQYLSLLPSFRTTGCPGCYYPLDMHLTPLGNELAADYVAKNLKID